MFQVTVHWPFKVNESPVRQCAVDPFSRPQGLELTVSILELFQWQAWALDDYAIIFTPGKRVVITHDYAGMFVTYVSRQVTTNSRMIGFDPHQ